MSWLNTTIGKLIDLKHGFPFKSIYFSDTGEYVVLTPGNCHNEGGFKSKGDREKWYVGEVPEDYVLNKGDLLVVLTDLVNTAPVLGGSFLIPEDNKYLHNQRLGLVRVKAPEEVSKKFLYYLFNTHGYRGQVRGSASGATVRHTSPDRIKSCNVRIPAKYDDQQEIADILSAYDDLIENNKRRIALLEESARQLYKEWFVRFRFPGHEHVKIVDGVPEGWDKSSVTDAILINPKTSVEKGQEIKYVPMSSLSESQMTVDTSKFELRSKHTNVKFKFGDTLFARITPCLENGKTAFVSFLRKGEIACGSTEFIIMRAKKVSAEYVYLLSRDEHFRSHAIKSMVGSSGRQRVQASCFDKFFIAIPPLSIQNQFNDVASSSFKQIANLEYQIEQLKKARDLLLPKLMSGELAV